MVLVPTNNQESVKVFFCIDLEFYMPFTFARRAFTALLFTSALGATAAVQAGTLVIAASEIPHAQLLEYVKPALAKDGVNLEIKVFSDYVQPNLLVADKQLDANFFQHQPYLDTFNKDRGLKLVSVGQVHVEPFGAYSRKIKSLDDLKDGATVALPNDPSNSGRALLLLAKQKLIGLRDGAGITATPADVVENPRKLKFRELEAAMLPRALDDVDLALINTNYALEAGLVPTRDALFIEGSESPYANIVVTREDNRDSPDVKKLVQALHSADVRGFIEKQYKGAVVPAF